MECYSSSYSAWMYMIDLYLDALFPNRCEATAKLRAELQAALSAYWEALRYVVGEILDTFRSKLTFVASNN